MRPRRSHYRLGRLRQSGERNRSVDTVVSPATISVCLGFARTAIRQEATSEDDGRSPIGLARWARSRMDS
jgi:hypothetical protein